MYKPEDGFTPVRPSYAEPQSKHTAMISPSTARRCTIHPTITGRYVCVPGLRRVMPHPPPPAPVSLLCSPRVSVTLHRASSEGWPTPITLRWCWLMSISSCGEITKRSQAAPMPKDGDDINTAASWHVRISKHHNRGWTTESTKFTEDEGPHTTPHSRSIFESQLLFARIGAPMELMPVFYGNFLFCQYLQCGVMFCSW